VRNGERGEAVKTLSSQQLEQLWATHLKGEFETKDVEATLATMVDDAYVNHMPVNTGGRGKEALRVSTGMTSFRHGRRIFR
jgi:carboxymethylenebutenolidase